MITPPPPPPKRITMIIIVGVAIGSLLGEPISDLISLITGYEPVQGD